MIKVDDVISTDSRKSHANLDTSIAAPQQITAQARFAGRHQSTDSRRLNN